ncbi:hypothetical protein ACET3Z_022012 [Daucus carota]
MGRQAHTLSTGDFSKTNSSAARNPASTAAERGRRDGKHINLKWEDVLYIQESDLSNIKEEARHYKDLLEDGLWEIIERGNTNILRYVKNRLERIKRCVDLEVREKAVGGDKKAIKQALRKLMLTAWEGPIIKFADQKLQFRLEKGEQRHKDFILHCQKWVDENVLRMVQLGDKEGLRMASNQAHYKSLRNMEAEKSYLEKSYLEATLNKGKQKIIQSDEDEEGWQQVKNKKKGKKVPVQSPFTIYISGIPENASAKKIWEFFTRHGEILDIILPRRRDKNNRRFGFVKVPDARTLESLMNTLKFEAFYSQPLHMSLAKSRNGVHKDRVQFRRHSQAENPHIMRQELKTVSVAQPLNKEPADKKDSNKGMREEDKVEEKANFAEAPLCLDISNEIETIASKSMICFSEYPLNGDILQDILMELGFGDILVKEINCYKFILSFQTKKQRDIFDFSILKDWIIHPRPMEEEDYRIKRKALVEIRGLPCNSWTEDNLKKIVKDQGSWGWWENNPMYCNSLENPRVWMYLGSLEKVSEMIKVKIGSNESQILIHELETQIQDGEKGPDSRKSAEPVKFNVKPSQKKPAEMASPNIHREGNKTPVDIHPSKITSGVVEQSEDQINCLIENQLSDNINQITDPIDPEINTGDLQTLEESSQNSICNIIRKLKICRSRKGSKKKARNNPFDIGRCKFNKINKRCQARTQFPKGQTAQPQRDLDKEANEILQMAEDMGLQLKKAKKEAIKDIKDQLLRSLI